MRVSEALAGKFRLVKHVIIKKTGSRSAFSSLLASLAVRRLLRREAESLITSHDNSAGAAEARAPSILLTLGLEKKSASPADERFLRRANSKVGDQWQMIRGH
jgi:hypothetical protein